MRNIQTPGELPQNLLFDDFEATHWLHSHLAPSAVRFVLGGWQGVFRRSALKLLPAEQIGQHFSPTDGRPTKEIHAALGLVFIMEFKGWSAEEAAQAYALDAGVQFALNLPRDRQYICPRTVETYKALLRDGDDHAAAIFGDITHALVQELQIDISKQRLDSTHLFSNMARMGRSQLMGAAIKRFLTQLLRHEPAEYQALPEELIARYRPAESRLFGYGKATDTEYAQRVQQLAEDMLLLVERFASHAAVSHRTSYQALARVLREQCDITQAKGGKGAASKPRIALKPKATDENGQSSHVMQNPSDPDAGYDGHKGAGYQTQLSQAYDTGGANLIVGCLPQSAGESDATSLVPVLESQADYGMEPESLLADTAYGSDANQQACADGEIKLISPVGGQAPKEEPKPPLESGVEAAKPSGPKQRLEQRRLEQETVAWKEQYAKRSGIEGLNRALDRVTGIKRLFVRGMKAVKMAVYLKVTGWNILQAVGSYAAASAKARKMKLIEE